MCYNCGCEMLSDDMGNAKNITEKTIEEAAAAAGVSVAQAKKNMLKMLQKEVNQQPQTSEN